MDDFIANISQSGQTTYISDDEKSEKSEKSQHRVKSPIVFQRNKNKSPINSRRRNEEESPIPIKNKEKEETPISKVIKNHSEKSDSPKRRSSFDEEIGYSEKSANRVFSPIDYSLYDEIDEKNSENHREKARKAAIESILNDSENTEKKTIIRTNSRVRREKEEKKHEEKKYEQEEEEEENEKEEEKEEKKNKHENHEYVSRKPEKSPLVEKNLDVLGFPIDDGFQSSRFSFMKQQEKTRDETYDEWEKYLVFGGKKNITLNRETIKSHYNDFIALLRKNNIPWEIRREIWREFSGAKSSMLSAKDIYPSLILCQKVNPAPSSESIERDIERTFPDHEKFQGKYNGMLQRILECYAWKNTAVGYHQGMNYIVGLLLLVWGKNDEKEELEDWEEKERFQVENDVFFVFSELVEVYMPFYFSPNHSGLHWDISIFKQLLALHASEIYNHFKDLNIMTDLICVQWLLPLFAGVFPTESLLCMWDLIIVEGPQYIFTIALGFLQANKRQILKCKNVGELYHLISEKTKLVYDLEDILNTASSIGCMAFTRPWLVQLRSSHRTEYEQRLSRIKYRQGLFDTAKKTNAWMQPEDYMELIDLLKPQADRHYKIELKDLILVMIEYIDEDFNPGAAGITGATSSSIGSSSSSNRHEFFNDTYGENVQLNKSKLRVIQTHCEIFIYLYTQESVNRKKRSEDKDVAKEEDEAREALAELERDLQMKGRKRDSPEYLHYAYFKFIKSLQNIGNFLSNSLSLSLFVATLAFMYYVPPTLSRAIVSGEDKDKGGSSSAPADTLKGNELNNRLMMLFAVFDKKGTGKLAKKNYWEMLEVFETKINRSMSGSSERNFQFIDALYLNIDVPAAHYLSYEEFFLSVLIFPEFIECLLTRETIEKEEADDTQDHYSNISKRDGGYIAAEEMLVNGLEPTKPERRFCDTDSCSIS